VKIVSLLLTTPLDIFKPSAKISPLTLASVISVSFSLLHRYRRCCRCYRWTTIQPVTTSVRTRGSRFSNQNLVH
jgi:hypothetical protein